MWIPSKNIVAFYSEVYIYKSYLRARDIATLPAQALQVQTVFKQKTDTWQPLQSWHRTWQIMELNPSCHGGKYKTFREYSDEHPNSSPQVAGPHFPTYSGQLFSRAPSWRGVHTFFQRPMWGLHKHNKYIFSKNKWCLLWQVWAKLNGLPNRKMAPVEE